MLRRLLPFLLLLAVPAHAQRPDKTFSPYFYVSDSAASLPLLHTGAEVKIAGVIADVKVVQVYRNKGKNPIEAIYVFPASTRAAVHAMKMKIGRRSIHAEIRERGQARKDYEAAKTEGKTASLLEQDRPNIFQMNVANILPGDSITVELSYTEMIVPTEGVYEFVYPTVVGPRYTSVADADPLVSAGGARPSAAGIMPVPVQPGKELPKYSFGMRVEISTGVPVQDLNSPSHKTQLSFETSDVATVLLDPSETQGGNRDFVLRYRLAGSQVQNGLITYKENGENFFLFTMQPPKRVSPDSIPPREYIFVMDVSGSMNGYPIEISKKLLRDLVGSLKETDRFNLVLFAGYANMLSAHSLPATAANIDSAIVLMGKQSGSGGTELKNAMERAMSIPRPENFARSIVICTDGFIGNEAAVFESIRNNLSGTSVFAFGVGSSVNRFLIEGLAHSGSGEPFVVLNQNESQNTAEKFRKYVSSPVLTNIKVDFGAMNVYDVEPPQTPDLFAEKPIVICGKYKGSTETSFTVSGQNGNRGYKANLDVRKVRPRDKHRALRYLWARERIRTISDYAACDRDSARIKDVTKLGLEYNLLTNHTSFIAVDDKVRNKEGKDSTVVMPLPLPQGVNNNAVGNVSIITGGTPASYGNSLGGVVSISRSISVSCCEVVSYCMPARDISMVERPFNSVAVSQLRIYDLLYQPENLRSSQFVHRAISTGSSISDQTINAAYPKPWIGTLSYSLINTSLIEGFELGNSRTEIDAARASRGFTAVATGNHFGRFETDLMGGRKFGERTSASLLLHGDYMHFFTDRNKDGFADQPTGGSGMLQHEWRYSNLDYDAAETEITSQNKTGVFLAQIDSKGGQLGTFALDPFSTPYKTGQLTRNGGLYHQSFVTFRNNHHLVIDAKGSMSEVSASAGSTNYRGEEQRLRTRVTYNPQLSGWDLQTGISFIAADLHEQLRDSSGARREMIPGIFAETDFDKRNWNFRASARLDHHSLFGPLFTPLLKIRYDYSDNFNVDLLGHGGYRVLNPVADNLHLLQSAKQVSVMETLRPEHSYVYGGAVNYCGLANHSFRVSAGFYRTDYLNAVVIDRDTDADRVRIANLDGKAFCNTARATASYMYRSRWSIMTEYIFKDKQLTYNSALRRESLSPQHRLTAAAALRLARPHHSERYWEFGVSGNILGPQRLPLNGGAAQEFSPAYGLLNLRVEKSFAGWLFFLHGDNMLDYRMPDPVLGLDDTAGPAFEASQQWAPVVGRVLRLGVSWKMNTD